MKPTDNNSNVTAFPDKAAIKEEAGAWIVKIDQGELSSEQVIEFQAWLSQSRYHKEYIEKLAQNWDSMSILSELAELFPLPESAQEDKKSVNRNWMPMWVMTSVSVCFLVAMLVFDLNLNFTKTEYMTVVGQQSDVKLDDGSIVSLNTDSHLEVDFSGDIRMVRLLKGEAHFDVAKNPKRPFVVYAGKGMVWAVGTAFNVRYTDVNVDVMVTEGTVKVYAESEDIKPGSRRLSPTESQMDEFTVSDITQHEVIANAGQTVSYREAIEEHIEVTPQVVDKKLAWQTGYLTFSGESLERALAEIARYTDKEIIITDDSIKSLQIGGHFKTNDIDGLLVSLGQGFDLDIHYTSDNRIRISDKTL